MNELRSVASPCINVCQINRRTGWCEGCRRTMDEIIRWPHAGDDERRAILARLPARVGKKGLWR